MDKGSAKTAFFMGLPCQKPNPGQRQTRPCLSSKSTPQNPGMSAGDIAADLGRFRHHNGIRKTWLTGKSSESRRDPGGSARSSRDSPELRPCEKFTEAIDKSSRKFYGAGRRAGELLREVPREQGKRLDLTSFQAGTKLQETGISKSQSPTSSCYSSGLPEL